MSWKLRVILSAMLFAPATAIGLGLGEIRLKSALNEPLSAEIDLVAVTPEELTALSAELASAEVFQRYGLDRPSYLDSLEFHVGRGQDGRNVLLVRSEQAFGEPFVTFLVDVNWSRGRLLREYTVLLDPPVLAPPGAGPSPAAVSAPRTQPVPARPVQEAEPQAASAAPADGVVPAADSYRVESGDTLTEIAAGLTGGDRQATRQMMISLFRANPQAFADNINVLRAGAILRVPPAAEVAGVSAGEASAEISRQNAAWRESGGGGRLRLVTPEEGAGGATGSQAESSGNVQGQIDSLERDINEQRRLLELKNAELARLQQDLARKRESEAAAAAQAAADQAAADKAAADAAAQAAADQAAKDKAAADAAAATTPAGESQVAPEDDTQVAKAGKPARKPRGGRAAAEEPGSWLESLTDNWAFLAGAAALLLAGGLGFGLWRRRREEDAAGALRSFDLPATAPVPSETMRLRALEGTEVTETPAEDEEEANFFVEERPVARPKAEPARPTAVPGHEETISAEAAIDLDQADPLAEADFHMAYGLYDQAVDIVRMALQNSPDRNDLKLKLAEIHFVAGDNAQFLSVARDLKRSLGPGGDWDRIVIMGRQLAPDEPMFAGGVQDAGVDLSLEGGDNRVDLDLLSAPEGDEGLDLDLGKVAATADSNAVTGESTAITFNLDDTGVATATTQELPRRGGTQTVEMPTLELPASESPTVETPAVRMRGDTGRHRLAETGITPVEATAEMAIDDLGLDVSGLDALQDADDATAITTGVGDDATQLASFVERTQRIERPGDDDGTAKLPIGDTSSTSMLPRLDAGAGVDFDLGADDDSAAAEDRGTEQLPALSELEPVTMSEVGTKLDLARAYMDMGDPDGARNILQEVLAEGSASQKQEARRLIDSLPGA